MGDLAIFNNENFGSVRTVEIDGKILFCGKDVATALGYSNPSATITKKCKGVSKLEIPSNGGLQKMSFITEGDLYRLIASSTLDTAQKFESWIFDEVIPAIHKTGSYSLPAQAMPITPAEQRMMDAVEKMCAAVSALTMQSTNLATSIASNTSDIATLKTDVENLKKKNEFLDKIPEMSARDCINMLTREYAKVFLHGNYQSAYDLLYKTFYYTFHINLSKETKDGQYKGKLDCAEAIGQLDNLKNVAVKIFAEELKK